MDKRTRLQAATPQDAKEASGEMVLMALVVSVMSAVAAEAQRQLEGGKISETQRLFKLLPDPSPNIRPDQILKIQLAALKHNTLLNSHDGMKAAYKFCSPLCRKALGGFSGFQELINETAYSVLLDFDQVEIQPIRAEEHVAWQRFTVSKLGRDSMQFEASLVRQQANPLTECWLTESVLPVE